jgi:hypothetical protein
MGWYVRPGMESKKAMASRVGTGDLDGQRRYQFASHAAREGDGGVRTISTGSLSWLGFFFDCAWYVAGTYMEWGLHGWVHRTVGTCSEKSCVCPSSLALMHARCSRLCNASYAKRTGGARCCNAARRYGHLHPFAHRCSAPSLAPEAAARAAESHRWYSVEDLLLTPCPRTPSGSQAARVICALCALHTHPTVAPQRLVVVERSC